MLQKIAWDINNFDYVKNWITVIVSKPRVSKKCSKLDGILQIKSSFLK